MSYTIDIVVDGAVNPMFIKANSALIQKNKGKFNSLDLKSKTNLLEDLWRSTYNAELVQDTVAWSKIKFRDSKSMTLFQLKWS
jgi:hypothetical protein